MKKILSIFTVAFAVLAISCNKELNQTPISTATVATFYKQPSDFIQGTNGAYNNLRSYPNQLLNLSEIRSDNIYGVSVSGRDWDPINDLSAGIAGNTYVEGAWQNDFSGIFKANTVIDQIAKNSAMIGSAALATRLQAECEFLRAFYYFDLLRYFGKVPLIDHPVTAQEARTIGRSSVSDVYKLIISDLTFAVANLPLNYTGKFPSYSTTDVGRVTKFGAEGLLARVYMTRSGPTYDIEGPGLASNEWNLAMPLLQDIITNGGFTFNPSYYNIFSYSNINPATNKEAVFDITYLAGGSLGLGASFPTGLAPANYFSSLGQITMGTLEIIPTSNNFVSSYEAGDVRKTYTVNTTGYTFAGNTENRPFFKKYLGQTVAGAVDVTLIPKTNSSDFAINFIAIRYTDILMMKAECILNGATGGTQTDVDAIYNQVRGRAIAGAIPKVGVTLPQLFDERRREFADEGLRWFDLVRSGNVITIMNNWIAAEDAGHRISPMVPNFIIYPVPQTQLDAQPGLYVKNPGY